MNFNQPTKQAKIGIIANFLYSTQKFARNFIPVLAIVILRRASSIDYSLIWWAIPIFLLIAIWAILNYYNFFFYINQNTQSFVVESGVINKSKLTIQLDKIQQVNVNQSFINKLVGVYSIEIDSAGSKDKEVVINSVSYEVAQTLKEILLERSNQNNSVLQEEGVDEVKNETKVKHISFLSLVKVGLTSNYLQTLGLILAFFVTLYERYFKLIYKEYTDEEALETYMSQDVNVLFILLFFAFIIFSVLMVNLVRTVFKFFNFKVVIENKTLVLTYGLLSTKNTIIRPNRVQIVRVIQNYLQKKMLISGFKISQVMGDEIKNKKTALEIPGCSPDEKDDLLRMIFGEIPPEPTLVLRPNYRFFVFRYFVFGVIPTTLVSIFLLSGLPLSVLFGIVFIYLSLIALVFYRVFKVRKMEVSDKFIKITSGFWDISESILEPNKIQKLTISQYFWQSKTNLGTINIHTAGGSVSFETTNYDKLTELMNVFAYQVESSNKAWM